MQRPHPTGAARGKKKPGWHSRPVAPERQQTGALSATLALVAEMLRPHQSSVATAAPALERWRRQVGAAALLLWTVTDSRLACLLRLGDAPERPPVDSALVLDRLRTHGALRCGAGELTGIEPLSPADAGSYAAAASPGPGNHMLALVASWSAPQPPLDAATMPLLQIATAALERLLRGTAEGSAAPDAPTGVPPEPVVALVTLDQHGTIVATSPAWDRLVGAHAGTRPAGAALRYGEIWTDASREASDTGAMVAAVLGVARGDSPAFRTVTVLPPGEDQWCVVTATPLAAARGAIVSHVLLHADDLGQLATRLAERQYFRLSETIPVPVWLLSPDGHWLDGNERAKQLFARDLSREPEREEWTEAFHVDDRARAMAAVIAARGQPADTELRVRGPDERYRWSVLRVAPRLGADGSLEGFVALCTDTGAKRHAEWAARRMGGRLLAAQEQERSYIGRELHDDICQQAALLTSKLQVLAANRRSTPDRLREGILDVEQGLHELSTAVHALSHRLHPAKLKLVGLVNTIGGLCRDLSRNRNVEVQFSAEGVPAEIPERVALSVFRVAQEAVQNALKHSGSDRIDVELRGDASAVTLRIRDMGRGFDPLASEAAGIGLLTMRERVELSGGTLTLDTTSGRGATILARLPLADAVEGVTKSGEAGNDTR